MKTTQPIKAPAARRVSMHDYIERSARASHHTPDSLTLIQKSTDLALVKPQPFARPAGPKLQRSRVLIRRTSPKPMHSSAE